jgi:Fic family protein
VASVRRRRVKGKTYFYLVQTFRFQGRVRYRERYLGRRIPRDLEVVRRELLAKVRAERWYPELDAIRDAFQRERSRQPAVVRRDEIDRFGIEFTYNTNRIEGSTLTLRETAAVVTRGVVPKAKPLADVLEARAHHQLFLAILAERGPLSVPRVIDWHRTLFETTKPTLAGRLRDYQVGIGGSRFVPPPPAEVPRLLSGLFRWYNRQRPKVHPVELAAILHLRFETIHPFGDGNGRIGRLIMNYVLSQAGFPLLDIRFERREQYYRALERAHTARGERSFLEWFLRTYVAQHRSGGPSRVRRRPEREVN